MIGTSQRGFTLLEVLVALGILSMGITSALALFTAATAAQKRAIDRTHAAAIAEHVFADVESALEWGKSPKEILDDLPLREIEKNWPGYEVVLQFYNVMGDLMGDEFLLEVRIFWRYRGQSRELKFQQIITRTILIK